RSSRGHQPRGRAGPAFGARIELGAQVRRRSHRVRVGLDAHPRRAQTPRHRPRVRPVGPRRLAGTAERDRRDRRRLRLGHSRLHRTPGALARRAGTRREIGRDALRRRAGGNARRSSRSAGGERMKRFARLYTELDETTATNVKVAALERYFSEADPADAAWAVHFLGGRRPKRLVRAGDLRRWAAEAAGIPDWLFEESYHAVGDLAETIALLLPPEGTAPEARPLAWWVEDRLLALRGLPEPLQRELVLLSWSELDSTERFVWTKLVTGAFRVGVSQRLVVRAVARA